MPKKPCKVPTQERFLKGLSRYTGYSYAHCKEMYLAIQKYIRKWLLDGEIFKIHGVCRIERRVMKPRNHMSINDGKLIFQPTRYALKCVFSQPLKAEIAKQEIKEEDLEEDFIDDNDELGEVDDIDEANDIDETEEDI